jgi:ZIP family zinc transporter/zinc and cadmium transporter
VSGSLWSFLLALVAAAATIIGGLIVVIPDSLGKHRLSHLIAFGAGFMLSAAFLEMIPESIKLVRMAPLLVLVGYMLAHLFEHTFTPHFHFGEETHAEHLVNPGVSVSAMVGLVLHAMFDGISISSGFMVSTSLGFFISLAVILHKIPEGVTIASVMLVSGRNNRVALNSTVVLGAATIFGTLLMLLFSGMKGVALALSAGIATYVAATDLIPELNKLKEMRFSLSALFGVVLYFVVDLLLGGLGIK